ncbi:hypothetical protein DFH29DRAFT_882214 [Suillus ampliporus]|nr:hypothetical protein DFH29DRAFT_882214 [Suillus ampliporus]
MGWVEWNCLEIKSGGLEFWADLSGGGLGADMESPTKLVASPPSSPKKKKQKRAAVTTVLDPPPFVLPILVEQPSLSKNNSPESLMTNLLREDIEPVPEHQSAVGEASSIVPNIQTGAGDNTGMGFLKPPPTVEEAQLALDDIKRILRPPKKTAGYEDPRLDSVFHR